MKAYFLGGPEDGVRRDVSDDSHIQVSYQKDARLPTFTPARRAVDSETTRIWKCVYRRVTLTLPYGGEDVAVFLYDGEWQ